MITRHCQLYIVGVYLASKASQSAIKFPNCNEEGLMVMHLLELCFDYWLLLKSHFF